MSEPNPVTNAFFFGRALAEVLSEKLEESFTSAISELGRFDAEQRENLRQLIEEVQFRAENSASNTSRSTTASTTSDTRNSSTNINFDIKNTNSEDLQAMLDELRAEIATLRSELKKYKA